MDVCAICTSGLSAEDAIAVEGVRTTAAGNVPQALSARDARSAAKAKPCLGKLATLRCALCVTSATVSDEELGRR